MYSVHNWVEDMGLECKGSSVGYIGTVFFAGFSIGAIIFSRMADIYGRKNVYKAVTLFGALVQISFLFIRNFPIALVGYFFFGLTGLMRMSCAYLYMIELTPKK